MDVNLWQRVGQVRIDYCLRNNGWVLTVPCVRRAAQRGKGQNKKCEWLWDGLLQHDLGSEKEGSAAAQELPYEDDWAYERISLATLTQAFQARSETH